MKPKTLQTLKEDKMHDIDNREIKGGWLLERNDGYFCRVDYVGKERIITACSSIDKNKARNMEFEGDSWTQEEILRWGIKVAETRPLGVFDKKGKEYFEEDKVMYGCKKCKLFDGIKSRDGDGRDYILVERDNYPSGWAIINSKNYEILPKEQEINFKINITQNGKPYHGKLSIESLRNLGVAE